MGARNCTELGINLQKICTRLFSNDNLIKLLYYTDTDPLSQDSLSLQQKQELFNKLIYIVPNIGTRENDKSTIAIYIPRAMKLSGNSEFKTVTIAIDIFVPLTQWIIKDDNLRPFAIMGEIEEALRGKTVNGLGKIEGGNFDLTLVTDEISVYRQTFTITEYE